MASVIVLGRRTLLGKRTVMTFEELYDLLHVAKTARLEYTEEDGWQATVRHTGGPMIIWTCPAASDLSISLSAPLDPFEAKQLQLEVYHQGRRACWLTRQGCLPYQLGTDWREWFSYQRLPFPEQVWKLVLERCAQVSKHLNRGPKGLRRALAEISLLMRRLPSSSAAA